MTTLNTILDVSGHMILARVFKSVGNLENANEEILDAELVAETDGYNHALKGDEDESSYLDVYPELRSAWKHGYIQGAWVWEIEHCSSCQEPDGQACPTHDGGC